MNIKIFYQILLLISIFTLLSCSDENIVGNFVADGEELEEGSEVFFLMYQNYPNPFNPSTSITFQVAKQIKLELTIWSEDWVKKETLLDKSFEPGVYQVTFNAEGYPSGEYFYTLTGEDVTQIMKMKIVK
jgi:uncharacterized protein YpbB